MSGAARLAAFAVAVAVVAGAAALAGAVVDPDRASSEGSRGADPHGGEPASSARGGGHPAASGVPRADAVRGLAVADDDLRLELSTEELPRGRASRLTYRIVDAQGRPVRDFDIEHEKRMHLIVVRRDLTGFQHVHPDIDDKGDWSSRVRLDAAGSYRIFADFARRGEARTLAADLRVDGRAELLPLPKSASVAQTATGYDVRLAETTAPAGDEAALQFTVTRGGEQVRVEPYLGADGHLVALREGDLAFLHVHPTAESSDTIGFAATFPTTGRYRLFLQFKHGGKVHTAAFTKEVR